MGAELGGGSGEGVEPGEPGKEPGICSERQL